ncbi:MAG: ATP synthase F1 subunit delta [Chitinophagales bacterium]
MSAEKLSRRYAKALFDEASTTGAIETIYTDLSTIAAVLKSSRELKAVFKSPVIQGHKKLAIVNQIFGNKVSASTQQFLQLLVEQGREPFMADIISAFSGLYNEYKGISEATVTTAVELDSANEQKIVQFIKSQSGNPNVKINKKTDPSILGGFIVDFGGKLYDNSVRYKLSKIQKEISLN